MPYRKLQAGDEVFIRAVVLEAMSDCFKLQIEQFPRYTFLTYAPVSEIARHEDIPQLAPARRERRRYSGRVEPLNSDETTEP